MSVFYNIRKLSLFIKWCLINPINELFMKKQFVTLFFFSIVVLFINAQTVVVSLETFPNAFNTGFSKPINSSFTGSTGSWSAYSTNSKSTIVVNSAYSQSSPYALKLVNYSTSGSYSSSTSQATSPTANLSNLGCVNSAALTFRLYTYSLSANNNNFTFFVEYSNDNGSSWTTMYSRTAAQLVNSYGSAVWTTINIPIPTSYFTSNFKYRVRGTQAASTCYNSYMYLDDICIVKQPCLTTCSSGFNPTGLANGFNVFVKEGVTIQSGSTDGGVALGGNLNLQGSATIAKQSSVLNYPVTSNKFGLVIGGAVNYNSGSVTSINNGKIRLGSSSGSRLFYKDCYNTITNFRLTPYNSNCNTAYSSNPRIQQQSTAADSDPLDINGINFNDAFIGINTASSNMSVYSTSSSCASQLNFLSISGTSPVLSLASNKINVINITGTNLVALSSIQFLNQPTANNPLVINVNNTGSLTWANPFTVSGLSASAGSYIIYNFYNSNGTITINGNRILHGALLAPNANLVWNNSNYLEGQIVSKTFTLSNGEIHSQIFKACLPICNSSNACVSTGSLTGGHSIEYLGVNYNGSNANITTTFTYKVTSGSSPNISHFAFGNFTCQSCFNDASDLVSASDGPVVMGTDPKTNICGIKFDFSVSSGQSKTVSFTLKGYYNVGAITFAVKAGQDVAYAPICGPICNTTPPVYNNLGNYVWNDSNNNGIKDPGEGGMSGLTIKLYKDDNQDNIPDGASIATTTTDVNGFYLFSMLPGNYIVAVVLPNGYTSTVSTATSSNPNNDTDNDNNGINIINGELRSNYITVSNGGEPITDGDGDNGNLTLDFGLKQNGNASIGDYVWNDNNANGIQDNGETGIAGVTVTISGPSGNLSTTTDANGFYQFNNLIPGTYTVTFNTPSGYLRSPSNQGSDDAKDSDPINGTVSVTLTTGQVNNTIDAGFYQGLNLGNLVWNDTNTDGDYDDYEPGVGGVTVKLYADANGDNVADGAAIATTTTNAQGIYNFSGLAAGNYIVGIIIPQGYIRSNVISTSSNPNNDINDDNNGINLLGANQAGTEVRSNHITLSVGGEPTNEGDGNNGNLSLDFGLCGTGGLGDRVWNDLDKDGIQDSNEQGIQGVLVTITYPDGTQFTVPTNENGLYFFPNLGPGNYSVSFATPLGQTPTLSNIGSNEAIDSDPINGTVNLTLAVNEVNVDVDAGFYLTPCTNVITECGVGYVTKNTNFVANGNFVNQITSPSAGNTYSSGAGTVYTFTGGSFRAQADRSAPGSFPDQTNGNAFSEITGQYTDANPIRNQMPFPGDPSKGVASSNTWIYYNGNSLNGTEYNLWEQNITGLIIGQKYTFRFYASNTLESDLSADPIIRIRINGTTGLADGTQVGGPITLTEVGTSNSQPLNGWVRIAYTFTATSTNTIFKITDAATGSDGDDVGLTAIGIDGCYKDTDGDCVADVDDIDDDNDGITDLVESGGYDPLADCDNDGIANYRDNTPGCSGLVWTDCNNDGINDFFDWDRDGIINELDLDSDNDGILDVQEIRDPGVKDYNNDGMVDGIDADGDGLLSTADSNDLVYGGTGFAPQDLDRDGKPNYLDLDSDGDGITDITEALEQYDSDGLTSGTDVDGDGVRAKSGVYSGDADNADNWNGFGAKGITLQDSDGDGKPNTYDIDSDNDGITDNVEGQSTCSYKLPCSTDVDGDGVGDCYDTNTSTCSRISGGITPFDKDGDGTPDMYDLDTDNDGAPDINEGSAKEGGFVTNYDDSDGDGLIDEFDGFNIQTATSNFTNNVGHNEMGPLGDFNGPVPPGSKAVLKRSGSSTAPCTVDRDWRNVAILPVKLIEFKGVLNMEEVDLSWRVTEELNMQKYEVERSINGRDYVKIEEQQAKGSLTETTYTSQDDVSKLNTTVVYYRLQMVEQSGDRKASNVLVFKLNKKGSEVSIYPNPATNYFTVKVQASKSNNAMIRVLDMRGRMVLNQSTKLTSGTNTILINDITNLTNGLYMVQLITEENIYTNRLQISR
jgi:choice-of-anchor A domain-containing protein